MNPDKLFSLLSPKQVLSQESQQAYQSKVDTAKAENKMIKEKVVNPFFSFADKSFKKIMEVLNPGESYVAPALKKIGVNPILASGIGLGVDILAPGPGELGRVAKVGKEVKAGSELIQEAKKYKSVDEFVKAQGKPMYRGTQLPQSGDLMIADTYGLAYGKGAYLAKDRTFAEQYGKNISELYPVLKKPLVMSAEAPKELLAQVKKDFPNWSPKYGTTGEDIHSFIGGSADEANAYLQKLGYDGLLNAASEGAKQTIVFDPKNILTKSQLTDIFNQAHATPKVNPLISEAKKYKSADEFVKAKKPNISKLDYGEQSIPIKDLYAHGQPELTDAIRNVKNGSLSRTTGTVEATQLPNGKIVVLDGQHRIIQAMNGGENTIKVNIIPYDEAINPEFGYAVRNLIKYGTPVPFQTKSQLTDIFNKAHNIKK